VDDDAAGTVVDGTPFLAAKTAALRAHATQISVDGETFSLSNGIVQPISAVERFHLVAGEPAGPLDAAGRETDLFAGRAPIATKRSIAP
jgi:N-acetyl-1-D-myo-inositol-2-amino-2-deoxy-alpha-D-glucopyranoside deacetylase